MEPDISPLAKRLAEENNVDWRVLHGSGAEGRIVERDILEYLARVMAGDEALNPTPEPVPEGMDAWPEEDVAPYYEQNASSTAPVAGDDGGLAMSDAGVAGDDLIDAFSDVAMDLEDEVLLDMDSDMGIDAGMDAVSMDAPSVDVPAVDAEVPVGMDMDAVSAPEPVDDIVSEILDEPMSAFDEPVMDEPVSFGGDVAADAMSEDVDAEISEDIFLFDEAASSDVAEAPVEDMSVEAAPEPEPVLNEGFDTVDEILAEAAPAYESAVDVVDSDFADADDAALFEVEEAVEAIEEPHEDIEDMAAIAEVEAPAPVEAVEELVSEAAPVVEEVPEVPAPVAAVEAEEVAEPIAAQSLPVVSYGVLLRRHSDLTPLVQAQLSVGQELGQDSPISPSSFLLRAAAKALKDVPLGDNSSVGLAVISDQKISIKNIQDASQMAFRKLISKISDFVAEPSGQTETVGLVIADMSDFDVDEVFLNVGAPVLTLGRILHDSKEGSYQSTLSLSGDIPVELGTKFLAAVAEFLDSPVRLVV